MDVDRTPDTERLALGWRSCFIEQISEDEIAAGWMPARVCRVQARRCRVWRADAELGEQTLAVALFGEAGLPAVGDWVLVDPASVARPRRLERFSVLTRRAPGSRVEDQVLAANVDTLVVVTACNEEFNIGRVERYLAMAAGAARAGHAVRAVVVLTKSDLTEDAERYADLTRAADPALRVEVMDARDAAQAEKLADLCGPGQTVAFLGSSGVGKSTLVNALSDAGQKTGEVRGDDNKGKHTTTSRSLHRLRAGGVLVDLPGIRELQLSSDAEGIEEAFADVSQIAAACRFRDCAHAGEPGCAVAAAIVDGTLDTRRWESFCKLLEERAAYDAQRARRSRGRRR